ncbi:MAG TPA: pyridoxal-phosphate dependent enzyme, partial [candidate division Zixibacteria bacterium]|nr:pyridoxal-phosphate dependent enzyme [candidate division Zixibacteria bacterium]
ITVNGSFDDAVNLCRSESAHNGWQVFSDTAWEGYRDIPRWIAAGYLTLLDEIHGEQDMSVTPDLVIVQGGVGALASTVAWYFNQPPFTGRTRIAVVEPVEAACLTESIQSENGRALVSAGALQTIMAGLNCGVPSPEAWRQIRPRVDYFVTITDDDCRAAMRRYYCAREGDPRIIAGESGAAGLGALSRWRERFELDSQSTVLLINTEGDTDPAGFNDVLG